MIFALDREGSRRARLQTYRLPTTRSARRSPGKRRMPCLRACARPRGPRPCVDNNGKRRGEPRRVGTRWSGRCRQQLHCNTRTAATVSMPQGSFLHNGMDAWRRRRKTWKSSRTRSIEHGVLRTPFPRLRCYDLAEFQRFLKT